MARTSTDVINDQKLDSLEQLLKIKHDNPTIETRHIMKMVEEILYPSGTTWIADNPIQKRTYTKNETRLEEADEIWESEDFSQKYELIGKMKKMSGLANKFINNPWGIVIGRYEKCPICKKVSVEGIKLDKNPASNRTYVRHKYTHSDDTSHSTALENYDGQLDYKEICERVMKKK